MKHSLLRLSILALLLMVKTTIFSATVFVIDGINYYILSESEVEIQGHTQDIAGNIVIPGTVNYNSKTYSVISIGGSSFRYCDKLTSISIPNGIKYIGEFAFQDCDGLTTITIPNSVQTIGFGAFNYCDNLKSVSIPNSVKV